MMGVQQSPVKIWQPANFTDHSHEGLHLKIFLRRQWEERQRTKNDFDEDAEPLDDQSNSSPSSNGEDDLIQVVRKDSFFTEHETETDMHIIHKRVEMQQRQFVRFQKRERARKIAKIRHMYEQISVEEATTALQENKDDEEAVILKFTEPDYLHAIRKSIALAAGPALQSVRYLTQEQQQAYEELRRKRSRTLKKTTSAEARAASYDMSRLRLDDALAQLSTNPEKGMEGWSEARIRAYSQISVNPNAYFYRFNPPGEAQQNGPWTDSERDLFFQRLAEVGANGQWGIFSMTIPGRVGYQCANFYRRLVEHKEIEDPNYYVDDSGNAHYLFSGKKDVSGGMLTLKDDKYVIQRPRKAPAGEQEASDISSALLLKRQRQQQQVKSKNQKKANKKKNKKKRRGRHSDNDDDDDSDEDFDGGHDDRSDGTYTSKMKGWGTTSRTRVLDAQRADRNALAGQENTKRQKVGDRSSEEEDGQEDGDDTQQEGAEQGDEAEETVMLGTRAYANPLPGFMDPITLEEVRKPAMSPEGHVMSYDTWIRCLVYNEPKNKCPFTKKTLNKRDLVLLTPDNIHAYRDRIVSLP